MITGSLRGRKGWLVFGLLLLGARLREAMRSFLVLLTAASALQLRGIGRVLPFRSVKVRSSTMPAPTMPAPEDASASFVRKNGLEIAAIRTLLGSGHVPEGVSRTQAAKGLFREFGASYLITSISLAILSYAICFSLIAKGFCVASLLRKVGLHAVVSPNAGTATIAYAVHKTASPIRFPPTVALTPVTARLLKRQPRM